MFEESKIRNPPHVVCKILMNIWNILLAGKWGLQPYAQPVSAMTVAGQQYAENWWCVFIFLMMLYDSQSDPAELHLQGLIRKRGGKKRIFLCHCFCWAHWCGKCEFEVCGGLCMVFVFFKSKIVIRLCQDNKNLKLKYIKIFSGGCWQLKYD